MSGDLTGLCLYIYMNVVRSGTLGGMPWMYWKFMDLVSIPPSFIDPNYDGHDAHRLKVDYLTYDTYNGVIFSL